MAKKKPEVETTRFLVTIPVELRDALDERCADECRSRNSYITALLKDNLTGGNRISFSADSSPVKKVLRKK